MAGEKSEQPTPKKRQDARRRGQVAISRETESAFSEIRQKYENKKIAELKDDEPF